MKTKELFGNIRLIYEKFDFSSAHIIDDLMIISNDNHYQLHFEDMKRDESVSIKIEINHSLINGTRYSLYYELKSGDISTYGESDEMVPNELYTRISPIIREFKIKIIEDFNDKM